MGDRVDKAWQAKGLRAYATGAILSTLAHYGVQVDEAGFKEASKDALPLEVAESWLPGWTGKGQFKAETFLLQAATVLYERAWPDRLTPPQLAEALVRLIGELRKALDERPSEPGPAFDAAEALSGRVPAEEGQRKRFMDEVAAHLGERGLHDLDAMAETLAEEELAEHARRFALLEEALLPERRGVSTSLVQAALGEKAEAVAALEGALAAKDATDDRRVMALDALIHLEEREKAKAAAENLLDRAEEAQDHHLALALCERLAHLYEALELMPELQRLADRAEALAEAHRKAHPHHG